MSCYCSISPLDNSARTEDCSGISVNGCLGGSSCKLAPMSTSRISRMVSQSNERLILMRITCTSTNPTGRSYSQSSGAQTTPPRRLAGSRRRRIESQVMNLDAPRSRHVLFPRHLELMECSMELFQTEPPLKRGVLPELISKRDVRNCVFSWIMCGPA